MENFVIIKSTMNALMSVETFGHGANSGCYRKWGEHQARIAGKQTKIIASLTHSIS